MERGRFIVLEGQGYSGKTEQAQLLVARLEKEGIEAIETQEPGGVEESLKIREELMQRRAGGNITPEEELGLFYKARGVFLDMLVRPNLTEGKWILSTRFSASTFVYQGYEGGIDLDLIQKLDNEVVGDTQPDLYILLDVEEQEIMRRMKETNKRQRHSYNELDEEKIRIRRHGYLELAKENKHKNWVIINGNQPIEQVSKDIWKQVRTVLPK